MDTTSSPVTNTPAAHSPSDVSYSSGASRTSTRTTSPATSSHRPSPRLVLHRLALTDIEPTSNSDPHDPQLRMDRATFQSTSVRRDRLPVEHAGESSSAVSGLPLARQLQQHQGLRPSAPIGSHASRSLTSANWRTQPMAESPYSPFDPSNAQTGFAGRGPTSFPASTAPRMEPQASLMLPYPDIMAFSDVQLEASYAYCFDRGGGQYTRLIPADMLPPLQDVPQRQQGTQGMIILPQPRALPPNGRSSNTQPVALATPPATPTTPADNIQTRIDTIVASTPATPTHGGHAQHHGSSNHGASGSGAVPGGPASNSNNSTIMGHMGNTLATTHHHGSAGGHHHGHHHHHHHSHSHSHNHHGAIHPPQQQQQQQQQRRPKIYCDKWVHEGVCAFTQQGCKYKHEMPLDKATQHQLGLFHGLPSWWKKHQAELARQRDPPLSQPLPPPSSQQEAGAAGAGAGAGAGGGVRLSDGDGIGGAPEGGSSAGGGASCGGGGGGSGGSGLGGLTTGAATPTNPNAAAAAGTPGLTWRQHRDAPGLASAAAADAVRLVRGGLSASTHAPVGSRASSVWNHSPYGPIAPPQRTSAATLASAGSGSGSGSGGGGGSGSGIGGAGHHRGAILTSNPYASLEALEGERRGGE